MKEIQDASAGLENLFGQAIRNRAIRSAFALKTFLDYAEGVCCLSISRNKKAGVHRLVETGWSYFAKPRMKATNSFLPASLTWG